MSFVPPKVKDQFLVLDVTQSSKTEVYGSACSSLPMAKIVRDLCTSGYVKHCRVLIVKVVDDFRVAGSYTSRRVR